MFDAILDEPDASRAAAVARNLNAHAFQFALTGRLAVDAQLRAHSRPSTRRPLNDIDFVVESFDAIPPPVAQEFLCHHVHPFIRSLKVDKHRFRGNEA